MTQANALLLASSHSRAVKIKSALEQVGWQVELKQNPKEALEQLKTEAYEAVFCDEQLRGASAGGFLIWSRRLIPELPFHLLSDRGAKAAVSGHEQPDSVLAYPPVRLDLPTPQGVVHKTLVTDDVLNVTLTGRTSLMPISDIIEMMGISQQSGTLSLEGGKAGRIYINNGVLEHAESHTLEHSAQGLKALAQLLVLEDAAFQVMPYTKPARATIRLPAANAMTEAARLADEQRRFEDIVSALKAACPELSAVVTGYALAGQPTHSFGEVGQLFSKAKTFSEQHRELFGGKLTEAFVSSENAAYAFKTFGDNLLAASAPLNARMRLFNGVRQALKVLEAERA